MPKIWSSASETATLSDNAVALPVTKAISNSKSNSLHGPPIGSFHEHICSVPAIQRVRVASDRTLAGEDETQQEALNELIDGEQGLVSARLLVTGMDNNGNFFLGIT